MASLGALIAVIVMSVGGLVLLVLGLMMGIGAIMPKRNNITSWPMAQEQAFSSFDQRTAGSQSKAWMIALISAVGFFVLIVGITLGVKPEEKDLGKTMNMSNLTKKEKPAAAPAPVGGAAKAEPAPAPKETPPAEAPKAEAPKAEAPKAEAPKP